MRPIRLRVASLPVPFRAAFAHASASRDRAENILVQAEDSGGRCGHGEGCPRAYVTGETVATAAAFLERHREALSAVTGVEDLRAWLARESGDIDGNPSAACAAELALLDLFARQRAESLEALLGLPSSSSPVAVTAVYGLSPAAIFEWRRLRYRAHGMSDAKLKLAGGSADVRRAARLAGSGAVRLDANNLWADLDHALAALHRLTPFAWAVEEPLVRTRSWSDLRAIAAATGLCIILDESLTRRDDLEAVAGDRRFVLNLRVSKQGGLLRTLALLEAAQAHGHAVIIGAQVGETSLLARAGLIAAAAAGPDLVGAEIGYGRRLLRYDLASPSLTFGRDGQVGPAPAGPGSGLSPNPALLAVFEAAARE